MIKLRKIEPKDQERMLDILTDTVGNQTYMLPDFITRDDAVPLFQHLSAMSADPRLYVRAIDLDGDLIGFLNHTEIQNNSIELGYIIHPHFRHRGYMTQALRLAISELFSIGYREILTGAFACNTASIRVMEKCRMEHLQRSETIEYRGRVHECIYYAIRNREEAPC